MFVNNGDFPITEAMYDDPLSWCAIHAQPTDESCCCPKCEEDAEFVHHWGLVMPDSLGG